MAFSCVVELDPRRHDLYTRRTPLPQHSTVCGEAALCPWSGVPSSLASTPPSLSFSIGVHCVTMARDGLVYVCDRNADRIQVFHRDGTFVKEAFVATKTLVDGSVFDIDFTPDQKYLYVADGTNDKVWILRTNSMRVVGSFGESGHMAGQFRNVHSVTVDSKGNVYTGEVEGRRVQKFIP
jgi:DNA-binding beta-propeller fold protein YncE